MENRELDLAVAKIIGAPTTHQWVYGITQRDILGDYEGCDYCECARKPERENETCVKAYSTDRALAWEVVDWMLKFHCDFALECAGDNNWYASFPLGTGHGKTAAEAICRAALDAEKTTGQTHESKHR